MKSFFILVCFIATISCTQLNKTAHWSDLNGLDKLYDSTAYKLSPMNGSVDGCDDNACAAGNKTVFLYNLTYADNSTHKLCMCEQPLMNLNYTATKFGVVPKWIRQWTKYLSVASVGSDGHGAAAEAAEQGITFWGNLPTEVFVHEAAHNFDVRNNRRISQTKEWKNAINADSCVPDDYATNDEIEDFAQIAVSWMLLIPHGKTVPCMKTQLLEFAKWVPGKNTSLLLPHLKAQFLKTVAKTPVLA